jgi:hypothetical protein
MTEEHDINPEEWDYLEEGAVEIPRVQPKRRLGVATVKGIIVGKDDNQRVVPLEQVRKLAALHLSYRDMAEFFGVKENTFRDHFKQEVERYRNVTKQKLMEAMLSNAIDKMNPTMQIWLSKNIMGFADNPINIESSQVLPWLESKD